VHDDEVVADADLVLGLLAQQYPQWSQLRAEVVPPTGTDNVIFRLGDSLVVRMPRIAAATEQVVRDQEWLPRIAGSLPCAISTPVAVGAPGLGYPFPWAVHAWLPGINPTPGDEPELAQDLAAFVLALRTLTVGPPSSRSGPLSTRDQPFRKALAQVTDEVDLRRALDVWTAALSAPVHAGVPVWRHADLTPGNLLVEQGRLAAVIDFGSSGLGDPAVDLVPAWRVFRGRSREVFCRLLGADDVTWARGRGWALSIAVMELAYYRRRDAALADTARTAISEVLR
jgi:aminoglycoside phosphotransferase (APT) family kinase protein